MSEYEEHEHDREGHEHGHEGHDHDGHEHDGYDHEGHDHDGHEHPGHDHDHHDHDHDHTLISDRLPAGLWRIDPESSEVNFKARALFGLVPVSGYFEGFGGEMRVDENGNAEGTLTVETGTIHTGIARRDNDLRSSNYFNSDQHPHMVFKVAGIEASGREHLNLSGRLQLQAKDIALDFPVYAILHGDHLHIEGRVVVDHHSAGLGWAKPGMVGKTVRADVALTLNPATE